MVTSASGAGGVLVDASVPSAQSYKVVSDGGTTFSCYLMWTDLKNNHNKFYVSQGLQHNNGSFSLWTRYGRVGSNGVGNAEPCLSL